METAATFHRVRECLIDALELDDTEARQIDLHTTAGDLAKWNSLGHLALLMQLEEQFGIEFEDEEAATLGSVSAILDALNGRRP